MRTSVLLSVTLPLLCSSQLAAQGAVITVLPNQSIQAAVDTAVSGDVIVVSPGIYAPFKIDGKAISVIGGPIVSGVFQIAPDASVGPSVHVTNVPPAGTVTIGNMFTDHTITEWPAILVSNCSGAAVRLKSIQVTASQPLVNAQFEGLIEGRSTGALSLENVIAGNTSTLGSSATSPHAQNGLCGLYLINTVAKISEQSFLLGLASPAIGQKGGDGIRMDTQCELWMVRSNASGGNPPSVGSGGFALHDIGGPSASIQVDVVSGLSTNAGPAFAVNNVTQTPPTMLAVDQAEMRHLALLPDAGLALGQNLSMAVTAAVGNRAFVTLLTVGGWDLGPAVLAQIFGAPVTGRSNLGNMQPLVTVATGALPANPAIATVNLTMSNNASFLGTPITFQSLLSAPSGGTSMAFSSSLAFVMR